MRGPLKRVKQSWGVVFRRGLFAIGEADFRRIEQAMKKSEAA